MTWQVWRQDDNGNRFLVAAFEQREAAQAEAERLERAGHKQRYWVAFGGHPGTPRPAS